MCSNHVEELAFLAKADTDLARALTLISPLPGPDKTRRLRHNFAKLLSNNRFPWPAPLPFGAGLLPLYPRLRQRKCWNFQKRIYELVVLGRHKARLLPGFGI